MTYLQLVIRHGNPNLQSVLNSTSKLPHWYQLFAQGQPRLTMASPVKKGRANPEVT